MRKFFYFLFCLSIFWGSVNMALAEEGLDEEELIDDFQVTAKINTDSTVEITEYIKYNFGANQRHGIYRDIPYKYEGRYGNFNLRISDISVVDQDEIGYQYEVSNDGDYKHIKIGDSDVYVSGVKEYVIKYTVARAINFFEDFDEFYWNVTGNNWDVAISRSGARIIFPVEARQSDIKIECYSGAYGSGDNCATKEITGDAGMTKEIVFNNGFLDTREGLTVAVGFPKGVVIEPTLGRKILLVIKDNIILALPIFVFIAMFFIWRIKGRDPRGRGTIVAEFDAPDGLTPAEVGALVDERVNDKDVSSEIINLAVKGYVKIIQVSEGELFKKTDYIIKKLKNTENLSESPEERLFRKLFKGGENEIKLSELKDSFYQDLQEIKEAIYNSLVSRGYFPKNPNKVRSFYLTIGIVFIVISLFFGFSVMGVISIFASGLIVVIFSFFMSAKTEKGVLAYEHILGLKKYLQVAEKDRIEFHNAPEKNSEHFEKLLPLAMALGVEKNWANQFKDIYINRKPGWYDGYSNTSFSALTLTNSLGSFSSQARSTLSSVPASSGGSGSSGGGFSGGGGGGGGGGSW